MLLAKSREHATLTSRSGGLALGMFLALVLTGCTSENPKTDGPEAMTQTAEQPAGVDADADADPTTEAEGTTGLTADAIVAAIEPDGFTCEEQDPLVSDREQVIQCRAAIERRTLPPSTRR